MKKAFTRWYNYLIALLLAGVAGAIGIIPYFVNNDSSKWPIEYISYVFLFSGVVIFGVGFIIQDVYRARIRHKTKNWNNPLEQANINTAWAIFCPMFVGGLLCLLIGAVCSIFLHTPTV
ncbi:MAG: hypothetical protein MJ221_02160 [Bacilli bacterium]|nr:hypothetical protein [Bacilli bacterium]